MKENEKSPEGYLKEPYLRTIMPDADSGTFTASILEFPGCIAQGDSAQEAYENLEKTAISWLGAALDLGQEIPLPLSTHDYNGKVLVRLPKSLHRQVALTAEREGTSINQVIVAAISEKIGATNLYGNLVEKLLERTYHYPYQTVAYSTVHFYNFLLNSGTSIWHQSASSRIGEPTVRLIGESTNGQMGRPNIIFFDPERSGTMNAITDKKEEAYARR